MLKRSLFISLVALCISACASEEIIDTNDLYDARNVDIFGKPLPPGEKPTTLFGENSGLSFGLGDDSNAGAQLPVNRYIWRSSLEILSFLPLASTDPYGGVIITDWGSTAAAPNERFKVTAFITAAEFKPQSLRVAVNRQQKSDAGTWIASTVSNETARKLEDAILTRARQLRAEAGDDES